MRTIWTLPKSLFKNSKYTELAGIFSPCKAKNLGALRACLLRRILGVFGVADVPEGTRSDPLGFKVFSRR